MGQRQSYLSSFLSFFYFYYRLKASYYRLTETDTHTHCMEQRSTINIPRFISFLLSAVVIPCSHLLPVTHLSRNRLPEFSCNLSRTDWRHQRPLTQRGLKPYFLFSFSSLRSSCWVPLCSWTRMKRQMPRLVCVFGLWITVMCCQLAARRVSTVVS